MTVLIVDAEFAEDLVTDYDVVQVSSPVSDNTTTAVVVSTLQVSVDTIQFKNNTSEVIMSRDVETLSEHYPKFATALSTQEQLLQHGMKTLTGASSESGSSMGGCHP